MLPLHAFQCRHGAPCVIERAWPLQRIAGLGLGRHTTKHTCIICNRNKTLGHHVASAWGFPITMARCAANDAMCNTSPSPGKYLLSNGKRDSKHMYTAIQGPMNH